MTNTSEMTDTIDYTNVKKEILKVKEHLKNLARKIKKLPNSESKDTKINIIKNLINRLDYKRSTIETLISGVKPGISVAGGLRRLENGILRDCPAETKQDEFNKLIVKGFDEYFGWESDDELTGLESRLDESLDLKTFKTNLYDDKKRNTIAIKNREKEKLVVYDDSEFQQEIKIRNNSKETINEMLYLSDFISNSKEWVSDETFGILSKKLKTYYSSDCSSRDTKINKLVEPQYKKIWNSVTGTKTKVTQSGRLAARTKKFAGLSFASLAPALLEVFNLDKIIPLYESARDYLLSTPGISELNDNLPIPPFLMLSFAAAIAGLKSGYDSYRMGIAERETNISPEAKEVLDKLILDNDGLKRILESDGKISPTDKKIKFGEELYSWAKVTDKNDAEYRFLYTAGWWGDTIDIDGEALDLGIISQKDRKEIVKAHKKNKRGGPTRHWKKYAPSFVERALKISPKFAKAHYVKGGILETLGRLEDAISSYEKAVKYSITFSEARKNKKKLKNAQEKLNQFYHLIDKIDKELKISPNSFWLTRDLNSALKWSERATKLYSDNSAGWYLKAEILKEIKQFESAAESYSRAIDSRHDEPTMNSLIDKYNYNLNITESLKEKLEEVEGLNCIGMTKHYLSALKQSTERETAEANWAKAAVWLYWLYDSDSKGSKEFEELANDLDKTSHQKSDLLPDSAGTVQAAIRKHNKEYSKANAHFFRIWYEENVQGKSPDYEIEVKHRIFSPNTIQYRSTKVEDADWTDVEVIEVSDGEYQHTDGKNYELEKPGTYEREENVPQEIKKDIVDMYKEKIKGERLEEKIAKEKPTEEVADEFEEESAIEEEEGELDFEELPFDYSYLKKKKGEEAEEHLTKELIKLYELRDIDLELYKMQCYALLKIVKANEDLHISNDLLETRLDEEEISFVDQPAIIDIYRTDVLKAEKPIEKIIKYEKEEVEELEFEEIPEKKAGIKYIRGERIGQDFCLTVKLPYEDKELTYRLLPITNELIDPNGKDVKVDEKYTEQLVDMYYKKREDFYSARPLKKRKKKAKDKKKVEEEGCLDSLIEGKEEIDDLEQVAESQFGITYLGYEFESGILYGKAKLKGVEDSFRFALGGLGNLVIEHNKGENKGKKREELIKLLTDKQEDYLRFLCNFKNEYEAYGKPYVFIPKRPISVNIKNIRYSVVLINGKKVEYEVEFRNKIVTPQKTVLNDKLPKKEIKNLIKYHGATS